MFLLDRLDIDQALIQDRVILKRESKIEQSFVAKHDSISTVVLLRADNSNLAVTDDLTFYLFEYIDERGRDRREVSKIKFEGANVGAKSSLKLRFNPITDSKGKKYSFAIVNETKIDSEPQFPTDSISLSTSEQDIYPDGDLYQRLNNKSESEELKRDLSFYVYYSIYPHEYLVDLMQDFVGRLARDVWFTILYFFGIGVLIYIIYRYK